MGKSLVLRDVDPRKEAHYRGQIWKYHPSWLRYIQIGKRRKKMVILYAKWRREEKHGSKTCKFDGNYTIRSNSRVRAAIYGLKAGLPRCLRPKRKTGKKRPLWVRWEEKFEVPGSNFGKLLRVLLYEAYILRSTGIFEAMEQFALLGALSLLTLTTLRCTEG